MSALPPEQAGRLGPALLGRLPPALRRPAYDRAKLKPGMAHIGVGAFHRSHQAEYTEDLLEARFGPWGSIGINVHPPALAETLGRQDGLYTRLIREGDRMEARVVGSICAVVDSVQDSAPALAVLARPYIHAVTMTVTEKGYCHRPSTGALDLGHPDIAHDLAHPQNPRSLPGLLVRALELRMASHGRPLTLLSCDNIPANGILLGTVVRTLAERRGHALLKWIDANAAFPSAMVDRIAPAVTDADRDQVEREFGYRDEAVAVGEPFRQWVIESRFAGPMPQWDLAGATLVSDVEPFEHLKMRVLNGAQSTLSYLGVLAGYEHTCDDMADPLLVGFVRRMLMEEILPTLRPVPGIDAAAYVEQSLARLRNTAIRHRNHQIATDGSQKIVQRVLNPIRERLGRGQDVTLLAAPVAAWMAYLARASARFGRQWPVADPYAGRIAAIADRIGDDAAALAGEILCIDTIFDPALAADHAFRAKVVALLQGFLGTDPLGCLRRLAEGDSSLSKSSRKPLS
jgi:fructuronate reductase